MVSVGRIGSLVVALGVLGWGGYGIWAIWWPEPLPPQGTAVIRELPCPQRCQADLSWEDGSRGSIELLASQLTGFDLREPVPVHRAEGVRGTTVVRTGTGATKDQSPLQQWAGTPIVVIMILAGGYALARLTGVVKAPSTVPKAKPQPPEPAPARTTAYLAPPLDSTTTTWDSTVSREESRWRRPLGGVLMIASAPLCVLIGLTALALGGHGGNQQRFGTAELASCERSGPVSGHGLGYYYRCTATVKWDTGVTQTTTLPVTEMSPDDAGRQVRVVEVDEGRRSPARVVREDRERHPVAGFFGIFWFGLSGLGLLVAGGAALRSKPRRRSRREPSAHPRRRPWPAVVVGVPALWLLADAFVGQHSAGGFSARLFGGAAAAVVAALLHCLVVRRAAWVLGVLSMAAGLGVFLLADAGRQGALLSAAGLFFFFFLVARLLTRPEESGPAAGAPAA